MKKLITTTSIASGLLLTGNADITLTIDTTTNAATLVIDGTDTVSSEPTRFGGYILDFGNFTTTDNMNANSFTATASGGSGSWGSPVIGTGGATSLASMSGVPAYLHIEVNFPPPGTPPVGVNDWAGSIEITFFNNPELSQGSYTLDVTAGTATSGLTIDVIPEPSTAILISGSALALGIIRRTRRLYGNSN
jgi:hypothetical protein